MWEGGLGAVWSGSNGLNCLGFTVIPLNSSGNRSGLNQQCNPLGGVALN